jgi:site-specific DNA-cytosine methylase
MRLENVVSYFDGISCGQVALNKANIEVGNYFAYEIDKYAIKVAQKNYPNTKQMGSVLNVDFESLPNVDLLMGGSPCQGFSFAGAGLNFEDTRSKLFFEFVKAKEELKPKYWLLENVNMKKEYQDIISELLGVEPKPLNSLLTSSQNRLRLYWANFEITEPENKKLVIGDLVNVDVKNRYDKPITLRNIYPKKGQNGNIYSIEGKSKTLSAGVGIAGNGIGSSNAPKIDWDNKQGWRRLTARECELLQNIPYGYCDNVSDTQAYKACGNGWEVGMITHIFKGLAELLSKPTCGQPHKQIRI